MIRKDCPDAEIRLKFNEWVYIQNKWPNVHFNVQPQFRSEKTLVVCEPKTNTGCDQWSFEVARSYKTYVTFNPLVYHMLKNDANCRLIRGVPAFNRYYWLDSFPKEKIDGVCCLSNVNNFGTEGEIYKIRPMAAWRLSNLGVRFDVYCNEDRQWGDARYCGQVASKDHHSSLEHLKKISEYKFCFCPESTFHKVWSAGFVTERMFNCFKAKTIPIYLGAYDIEKYVPDDIFIDLRKYMSGDNPNIINWGLLAHDLRHFDNQQHHEQTEKAFEWQKTNDIGSIQVLERLLETL